MLKAALGMGNENIIVESDCAAVISNSMASVIPLAAWRERVTWRSGSFCRIELILFF